MEATFQKDEYIPKLHEYFKIMSKLDECSIENLQQFSKNIIPILEESQLLKAIKLAFKSLTLRGPWVTSSHSYQCVHFLVVFEVILDFLFVLDDRALLLSYSVL